MFKKFICKICMNILSFFYKRVIFFVLDLGWNFLFHDIFLTDRQLKKNVDHFFLYISYIEYSAVLL